MKITYSKGRTINTGNFNSVRVDVGIELDSEEQGDTVIEETFERAKAWVNKKIAMEKGD